MQEQQTRQSRLAQYDPAVLAAVMDARDEGLRSSEEIETALESWRLRMEWRARRLMDRQERGRAV